MADRLVEYFKADDVRKLEMALDPEYAPALEGYLGREALDDLRAVARKAEVGKPGHLGTKTPKNLIFLPGIMGSHLAPAEYGGLWWVDVARNRDKIDRLGLDPFGNDLAPEEAVVAAHVDQTYDGFLAATLKRDDFGCVKFPYDWRKSPWHSADLLKDKVLEIAAKNGGRKVHLVAHSMGGLVVRAALARHGALLWPKLGRIAFLGTPHYGSPAIGYYLKYHFYGTDMKAILALLLSRSTFRSLYGAVGLLPAPLGVYPGTRDNDPQPWSSDDPNDPYPHPCANFDLYDADAWKLGTDEVETGHLKRVLAAAAALYHELRQHHVKLSNELRGRMFVVAGVGQSTPFRLAYRTAFNSGFFEEMTRETSRIADDPHREGDGSVPLASAKLEGVTVRYVKGEHSTLPNIPAVCDDIFRWLNDQAPQLEMTPRAALARHLGGTDPYKSVIPHLDGSLDPADRWDVGHTPETLPPNVLADLDAGKYPAFHRVRIL